mmetsp:Transcript_58412/g.156142  ORF Transcript_58412/g.156142 Transcript_58412/m.156142 type:complete len:212 (-) Transcript_58412:264-899(-)
MVHEKRHLEHVLCRGPLLGVPVQAAPYDGKPVSRCLGDQLLKSSRGVRRKTETNGPSQLKTFRPLLRGGSPHNTADLVQLVNFRRTREQRAQAIQLSHDAAHGPDINGRVVVHAAQQHLRGTVPARRHIIRQGRPAANLPGKAKIGELHSVASNKEILGLQIPMKETLLVHELQGRNGLVHVAPHLMLWKQRGAGLHQLVHVGVHVLEDQM